MSHLPITDADRAAHRGSFAALLQHTMTAVGATPAPAQPEDIRPTLPPATARQLAGALVFVALALLVAFIAFRPGAEHPTTTAPTRDAAPAGQPGAPAAQPTEAAATIMAYAAPNGAALGPIPADTAPRYRHSDFSEWAGVDWRGRVVWIERAAGAELPDLAPPTPKPAPERIIVEVPIEPACDQETNPRYTARQDVYADDGRPLGIVTGASCESQADAQANADARAAAMRGE